MQCYAIEGRYLPSVEYLEENYRVQIDHNKYNVFYDGFVSNIMPEITVLLAEQEDAVKSKEKTQTKGQSISGLLLMLLFLVFCSLCALFLFLWEVRCMKISQNAVTRIFQARQH